MATVHLRGFDALPQEPPAQRPKPSKRGDQIGCNKLLELYGDAAFREACERARRALARGDRTEKLLWTQVALKVRHRTFGDVQTRAVQANPVKRAKVRKPRPAKRSKPCGPNLAQPAPH